MVATSAHHVVRMTVRVSVVSFHRDIDVTLPTSSTFAEILPELARLVDLPEIHRPWEVTTAGGAPLDMHTPLYQLKLHDGSVAVLRPIEHTAPPVVRDAADALRDAGAAAKDIRGLDAAATFAGLAALLVLALGFTGLPQALAAAGLAALCMAVVAHSQAVFAAVPVCAAAAAGLWVAGPTEQWQPADPALGVFAGALAAVVTVGVGFALQLVRPAGVAFTCTAVALLSIGATGVWLPSPRAASALVVLAGVFGVMATPGIATRAAGLTVPRVPTAGEDFDRSDEYQPDVDQRSATATSVASAISAAIAVCTVPALIAIGWSGSAWVFLFCLCVAGALVIHASRHHWAVPRVCLTVVALAGVVGASLSVARTDAHPALVVAAAVGAALCATAVLWTRKVPDLEPTTVVWFERAEAAAIIAVIPLAVHLTGLFDLIRGL